MKEKKDRKQLNCIKKVLDQKGIKQVWLTQQLGRSYHMVNSFVCNRKQPSLETLFQIAGILDVEVKDLIAEKESKNLTT